MFLYFYSIGSANSSVEKASDSSSEGCWFKPNLADIKNLITTTLDDNLHPGFEKIHSPSMEKTESHHTG